MFFRIYEHVTMGLQEIRTHNSWSNKKTVFLVSPHFSGLCSHSAQEKDAGGRKCVVWLAHQSRDPPHRISVSKVTLHATQTLLTSVLFTQTIASPLPGILKTVTSLINSEMCCKKSCQFGAMVNWLSVKSVGDN